MIMGIALLFAAGGLLFAFPGMGLLNSMKGANGHMPGAGAQGANYTKANATQMDAFKSAVASGDYATSLSLHNTYGLGGPMFSQLNETTFAKYSNVYNLQTQLADAAKEFRQSLGQNETAGGQGARGRGEMRQAPANAPLEQGGRMGTGQRGFANGFANGFERGFARGKGIHNSYANTTTKG